MTSPENKYLVSSSRKPWKLMDFIYTIFFYIISILTITTTILVLRRIHAGEKSPMLVHLSKNELKKIVKSINDELFAREGQSHHIEKVQLFDENNQVLWSEDLDATGLIRLNDLSSLNFGSVDYYDKNGEHEDHEDASFEASPDFDRHKRNTDVNSHPLLPRLVNCIRFKPVRRGKYLVSPSLEVLHTCYQSGSRLDELENGVVPQNHGSLRYDLEHLYLKCEEVFTEAIQDLTPELAEDYKRCKRVGAVDRRGADFIQHRFAQSLAEHVQETETTHNSIPENLHSSTTSLPGLDVRAFVSCAHVEYQMYESPESPNEAALLACERHGVTVEEIERGLASNPRSDQYRFDTDSLYIPCEEAFASGLNWITTELISDYQRCEALGVITQQTRRIIEGTFYEHIHGGATEKSPVKSTTEYETPASPAYESTTTAPATTPTSGRHAFANCRRIENKPYRICITVIASYSGPTAYSV